MRQISFFVEGVPVTKGSKTMIRTKDGKYRMVEAGNLKKRNRLKEWMKKVEWQASITIDKPFCGPVALEATFFLEKGKTVKRDLPHVKPDLDKLMRAIGDAMQSIAYKDDSCLTDLTLRKRYVGELGAGCFITIREYSNATKN